MDNISENTVENFAIKLLKDQEYNYILGKALFTEGSSQIRSSVSEPLLLPILQNTISQLNPNIPQASLTDALSQVQRVRSQNLIASNEAFHQMLTEGVKVSYQKDGTERGDIVHLIDFNNPENNDFLTVNQFTLIQGHHNKRPDIVIFVNGIPLVVVELKNPNDEEATLEKAYNQLQTYKELISDLFVYNELLIISDGIDAKAGSISAHYNRFSPWKSIDGISLASNVQSDLEVMIQGMLNKQTLLDLIRNFTVFEKSSHEDFSTGLTSVTTVKKIAAYHQYYAVNKAIDSSLKTSANDGNRKGGVIWHTQGSGKSLSMLFYAGKIIQLLDNPTIVVITDRNDLDDQLFETFAGGSELLRQQPCQATDRQHLKSLLKVASGGVVFTTIQKFQPDECNVYEELSNRRNIIVIADEAHRSHYGFSAKIVDTKDKAGSVVDQKLVYGLAKYLRDALPNATFLGFTGTPIEKMDKSTPAVFGN